jgi:hypothetical protein
VYSQEVYLLLISTQTTSNLKLLFSFLQDKRDVVYIIAGTTAVVVAATATLTNLRHKADLIQKDLDKEAALLKV